MWIDKEAYRLPQDDWMVVPKTDACGPWCPSDGHRVRLNSPGDNQAEMYADSRVRVLHHVLDVRCGLDGLVSEADLVGLLKLCALYGWAQEVRTFEAETYYQASQTIKALAGYIARHLSAHMVERALTAYSAGYSREGPLPM